MEACGATWSGANNVDKVGIGPSPAAVGNGTIPEEHNVVVFGGHERVGAGDVG